MFAWNTSLQSRHNGQDGVSNHQRHDCLLSRLFRGRSKKTSKLRVTGLCGGIHRWPVNSQTNGQLRGKCFHLMTSSWQWSQLSSYLRQWCGGHCWQLIGHGQDGEDAERDASRYGIRGQPEWDPGQHHDEDAGHVHLRHVVTIVTA